MSDHVIERGAAFVASRDESAPAKSKTPSRKALGVAGLGLLAALGGALYGHHWWTVGRFIESTDDAYVGGDVP